MAEEKNDRSALNDIDGAKPDMLDDASRRALLRKMSIVGAASVPVAMTLLDPSVARAQILSAPNNF